MNKRTDESQNPSRWSRWSRSEIKRGEKRKVKKSKANYFID